MNHRTGLDRFPTLLFPERLEDYIGLENLVRFLDAFVAQQDLHVLSFAKARSAGAGAPPYYAGGICSSITPTAICVGSMCKFIQTTNWFK